MRVPVAILRLVTYLLTYLQRVRFAVRLSIKTEVKCTMSPLKSVGGVLIFLPKVLSHRTSPLLCALCANVTSFIKPEVHNVSQRRQKMSDPLPCVKCTNTDVYLVPEICLLTDRHIQTCHSLRSLIEGGVIIHALSRYHLLVR